MRQSRGIDLELRSGVRMADSMLHPWLLEPVHFLQPLLRTDFRNRWRRSQWVSRGPTQLWKVSRAESGVTFGCGCGGHFPAGFWFFSLSVQGTRGASWPALSVSLSLLQSRHYILRGVPRYLEVFYFCRSQR